MIVNLLGTPSRSDLKYANQKAREYIEKKPLRKPQTELLKMNPLCTADALNLLLKMLQFDPV